MEKKKNNSTRKFIESIDAPITEAFTLLDANYAMDYLENAAEAEDL
jgi:hypothetical protein